MPWTAAEFRAAGYSAEEMRSAGATAKEMKEGGYSAADLKDGLYPLREIKPVGFTGAMIVLRPGLAEMHPAMFLVLLMALCYALYQLTTRFLAGVDDSMTTAFYSVSVGTVVVSCIVPFFWTTPDLFGWGLLALVGLIGGVSHFIMIKAFEYTTASTTALVASATFAVLVAAAAGAAAVLAAAATALAVLAAAGRAGCGGVHAAEALRRTATHARVATGRSCCHVRTRPTRE